MREEAGRQAGLALLVWLCWSGSAGLLVLLLPQQRCFSSRRFDYVELHETPPARRLNEAHPGLKLLLDELLN